MSKTASDISVSDWMMLQLTDIENKEWDDLRWENDEMTHVAYMMKKNQRTNRQYMIPYYTGQSMLWMVHAVNGKALATKWMNLWQ